MHPNMKERRNKKTDKEEFFFKYKRIEEDKRSLKAEVQKQR